MAILSPLAFIGLDLSDIGYHLTNQRIINQIGLQHAPSIPFWWLSDVVGGLWVRISHPWGLIGARLGGVLLYGLCAGITMHLLLRLTPPSPRHLWGVLLATLITAKQSGSGAVMILDYYTIPMLCGLLCLTAFIPFYENPTTGRAGLLGCLLGISLFTRLPAILLLLLPLAGVYLYSRYQPHRLRTYCFSLLIVSSTFLLVIMGIAAIFYQKQLLGLMVHQTKYSGNHYSLPTLIPIYLTSLKHLAVALILLILAASSGRFRHPAILITFVGLLLFHFFPSESPFLHPRFLARLWHSLWKAMQDSQTLLFACIFLVLLITNRSQIPQERWALYAICSSILPIALGMGSDSGLNKMGYGCWLLAGMAPILSSPQNRLSNQVLAVMTVYSCLTLYTPAYRDTLDYPWSLTTQGFLKGTITSRARQESVDALLEELLSRLNPGDHILTYPYIPMLYFATETYPLASTPWLETLSIKELDKELAALQTEKLKLIVKSRTITYDARWPNQSRRQPSASIEEKTHRIDNWIIETLSPVLIWRNADFEIWQPLDPYPSRNDRSDHSV